MERSKNELWMTSVQLFPIPIIKHQPSRDPIFVNDKKEGGIDIDENNQGI